METSFTAIDQNKFTEITIDLNGGLRRCIINKSDRYVVEYLKYDPDDDDYSGLSAEIGEIKRPDNCIIKNNPYIKNMDKLCELTSIKYDHWIIRSPNGREITSMSAGPGFRFLTRCQVLDILVHHGLYAAHTEATVGCFGFGKILNITPIKLLNRK